MPLWSSCSLSLYTTWLPQHCRCFYKLLIRPWGGLVTASSLAGGTLLSHSPAYLGTARDAAGKGRDMGGRSCVSGMREQACIFCHPSQGVNPAPEFTFLCDGKCDMAAPASLLLALPAGNPGMTSHGRSQRGSCGIQGQPGSSLAGQGMAGPCRGRGSGGAGTPLGAGVRTILPLG